MTKEKVIPQIRFSGFTDTWEQHKLGDHSEIVAGGTPNTGHPEYWNPKEIPWMSSGEINNKVIYSTDNMISKIGFSNSSAKWVKEKSVLIALAGQGKTRGTVAISEIPLTTNQSIAAIQPDSFLYYKFLFQNLEERYNELREVSSGDGTRGGLNKQIISDLEVLAPEIQEQIKIGDFLCGIDTLITLHQRKYDKLTKVKKAMLEKMFPENGSPYPEIRFKGFTDAWEQHKLGDHSEIVAGGTPNTGHPEYWNPKEIPWMSSGEINNKVIYSTDNMISKIGFSNSSAKWVKEKSVLIALAGQGKTRGTVAISEIPLTTNQSIAAIQPDSFLYYKFLFQNLEERYNELREVSSGDGTRGGLNKQIISDLEVLAPEIQEQIKIGDFLCGIDTLITLHQRM